MNEFKTLSFHLFAGTICVTLAAVSGTFKLLSALLDQIIESVYELGVWVFGIDESTDDPKAGATSSNEDAE